MRLSSRLKDLDGVCPEIAWKLTDSLFRQTASLAIGNAVFVLLGLIGFIGTGSVWYIGGIVFSAAGGVRRLWQNHVYATSRASATVDTWAMRGLRAGWIAAVGWGAWSAVILFETNKTFVLMVIGVQSATVIGAAVRNCAVRAVAQGQIYITLLPLFSVCVLSGDAYLEMYAGFVILHLLAALSLMNYLHAQTVRLLMQDAEKSALLASLEAARQDLEIVNRHLETLAGTDALTGLANRRTFDLTLAREWARSAREATPLSLLLLDVDRFKAFNDFYGHPAGDTCLCDIATIVASVVRRPGDAVARYGGEEFVVVLPNTELDGAVTIACQIKEAIRVAAIPHDASSDCHVTVSIGVACLLPVPDSPAGQLTLRADAALYAAKRAGRNRIHVAGSNFTPDFTDVYGAAVQPIQSPLRV